jgi:hypothetical protein
MRGYREIRPFPPGLRMIAGDPETGAPQSQRVVYWACGAGGGVRSARTRFIPTCGATRTRFNGRASQEKTFLELHVNYPDCWDGRRLDSPDHRAHMAHSIDYVCPASHPVKLPLIRLNIQYPTTGGNGLTLSSGGQFSGHADFFNAWDQATLARLVSECVADRCNDAILHLRRNEQFTTHLIVPILLSSTQTAAKEVSLLDRIRAAAVGSWPRPAMGTHAYDDGPRLGPSAATMPKASYSL